MANFVKTIKKWMLPIAMVTGASMYFIYDMLPEPVHKAGPFLDSLVKSLQPLLIFSMLFLTFSRIEPRDLKPHRWHWWLLLIQGGLFAVIGLLLVGLSVWLPGADPVGASQGETAWWLLLGESVMLCLICPTATAAAVVTRKLGGDVAGITTYTVLINIVTALMVPLIVPLIHPMSGFGFWEAFSLIVAKIFPLLIMPCLAAWLVRYLAPRLHRRLLRYPDLAFYLWAVALTLAIAVTTKSVMNTELSVGLILMMAAASLVCCIAQFALGRHLGGLRDCTVTAGQSLGQKNTVFAIWMGYTFMTPETAIVGGLYSVWHNLYNSWQLRRVVN